MEKFNVGVIGAGYVGLVTGACLAHVGSRVTLMNVDAERIAGLRQGRAPVYEPELEEMLAEDAERLRFATSLAEGT